MWQEYLSGALSSDELKLSQDSLVNSYPFEADSAAKRLGRRLHSYLYGVPLLSPEEYEKTIRGVSNKTIKEALKGKQTGEGWLIALVADKDVIRKQLEEEQKGLAPEKRLTITKVVTPDELVN